MMISETHSPAALHSFMSALFSSPALFEEHGVVPCEDDHDEALQQRVTTVVCNLSESVNCQINIVQDNACIHSKPMHTTTSPDMISLSSSESRWSNDSGKERERRQTSVVKQPRCPRRRLSLDNQAITPATTAAIMEMASPTTAATTTATSLSRRHSYDETQGPALAVSPTSITKSNRRHSYDETKDANACRPRFPQRRGSITSESNTTGVDITNMDSKGSDRMAHRPQRRSSLLLCSEGGEPSTSSFLLSPSAFQTAEAVYH